MTDRWEEVARVFGLAMDASPDARAAILDEACADDPELRAEVESLLEADATGEDLLGKIGAAVAELAPALGHDETEGLAEVGLVPGALIDERYRVGEVLGRGGMGVVVAAEHTSLGDPVAIKVLKPGALASERARQRFMREARAAARIKNARVAKVRDVGQLPSGAPYLVMDRLRGVDLAAVIEQRGPLPVAEACLIALQVCEALATAHASGVVHRDVKPGNLFLEQAPHGELSVKLLDFGISKVVSGGDDEVLTGTSDLVGSPAYMSPEQLRASRDVDARADVWSLGVVLYEMLSGARPFRGDSVADVSMMILVEPPPPLAPGLPPTLVRIVERSLRKRREERFASVGDMASALAPLVGAEGYRQARRVGNILGDETSASLADTVEADVDVGAKSSETPSRLPWFIVAVLLVLLAALALRQTPAEPTPTQAPASSPPSEASVPASASAGPPAVTPSVVPSTSASTTASSARRPAAPPRAPSPAPTVDPYATRP